ncbi:MAG: phenylphosphate carboxylase subunit gamma [Rhodoferax sp.]|jgi:phenylphosphate carboxylase gamma subunit|nr:phenylphosphate carboxylase subunit gamma [Rhodoferax sp.]MCL4740379.1 phenylphosphate carboxylase subunit gamma [Burkholderiaceae bacterium]MCP5289851.1 phenylphosphate carboxylase subunit gamma [Burkholderiaceae bacterium]
MSQWEVYVADLSELPEGRDLELTIRTLEPGIHKYTYKRAKVRLSKTLDELPDQLQVRFGRGQLAPQRFSIRVIEEVQRLPAKYQ